MVNFKHTSHLVLVFLIVNFEHVIAGWDDDGKVPFTFSRLKVRRLIMNLPGYSCYSYVYKNTDRKINENIILICATIDVKQQIDVKQVEISKTTSFSNSFLQAKIISKIK